MTSLIRVLSVLACLAAAACNGVATDPTPAPDACLEAALACQDACPPNAAPVFTQYDSCQASCAGTLAACNQAATPELKCERVDSAPHACDSNGCWATLSCNRDPSAEMGLTCTLTADGSFACKW